jgi:hypothetical protein
MNFILKTHLSVNSFCCSRVPKSVGDMAQVVEGLPSKLKALSSNSSTDINE